MTNQFGSMLKNGNEVGYEKRKVRPICSGDLIKTVLRGFGVDQRLVNSNEKHYVEKK